MRQSGCTDAIRNRIEAAKTGSVFILSDFSDLAEGRGDLYLGRVVHKATITVNESGVRAAAGTAAELNKLNGSWPNPLEVRLDRPFIFLIVEKETRIPIFIGVVNSVE